MYQPSPEDMSRDSFWDMSVTLNLDSSINKDTQAKKRNVTDIMKDAKQLKTQGRYDKSWDLFMAYHDKPSINEIDEEKFLQYFDMLIHEKKMACSTLWSNFSMLNSESQSRCGPKLNEYSRLIRLIKARERDYVPKQSDIFTKANIDDFLKNAPSSGLYALWKAALVLGLYGGLRCEEMIKLEVNDFEKDPEDSYWVSYVVSKQKGKVLKNRFHIIKEYSVYVKHYLNCLEKNYEGRIFRNFDPDKKGGAESGKYKLQVMGKNTLAKVPFNIATYLKLENAVGFTGHSFRRTSATLFANAGATSIDLKNHMNWKSDSVVQRYVNQSNEQKLKMSSRLNDQSGNSSNSGTQVLPPKVLNMQNCSNVVIHF